VGSIIGIVTEGKLIGSDGQLSDSDILSSRHHATGRRGPRFDRGGRRLVQFRHRGAGTAGSL